jgi:hypothetical protein
VEYQVRAVAPNQVTVRFVVTRTFGSQQALVVRLGKIVNWIALVFAVGFGRAGTSKGAVA